MHKKIILHNIEFKFPIKQMNSRAVELQASYSGLRGGVVVRFFKFNGQTVKLNAEKSVSVIVEQLTGQSEKILLLRAKARAFETVEKLQALYGFVFDLPAFEVSRRPHFAVSDRVAESVGQRMEITTPFRKIDASEGIAGHVDNFGQYPGPFSQAENFYAVRNYLLMPERLELVLRAQEQMTSLQADFSLNIAKHLEVLLGIESGVNRFAEAVENLGSRRNRLVGSATMRGVR